MNRLLSLVMLVGVLFLPGPLWSQATTPKAPEAGEVKINQANVPTAADVLARFTPGVEEVQVRGLNPQQAAAAFLSSTNNPLVDIGNGLSPGQKVDIRTTDGQRFRIQNEDGQLRVRIRDANLTQAEAEALANTLKGQFGRVEIRTAGGARVEVKKGVVEVEADHKGKGREGTSRDINDDHAKDKGKDLDHSIRGRDRAEQEHERIEMENEARKGRDRIEKRDKVERMDKMEKMERGEKFERSGRDSR
jgi:hypothetical protein